jgi:hypothetical protein
LEHIVGGGGGAGGADMEDTEDTDDGLEGEHTVAMSSPFVVDITGSSTVAGGDGIAADAFPPVPPPLVAGTVAGPFVVPDGHGTAGHEEHLPPGAEEERSADTSYRFSLPPPPVVPVSLLPTAPNPKARPPQLPTPPPVPSDFDVKGGSNEGKGKGMAMHDEDEDGKGKGNGKSSGGEATSKGHGKSTKNRYPWHQGDYDDYGNYGRDYGDESSDDHEDEWHVDRYSRTRRNDWDSSHGDEWSSSSTWRSHPY